MESYLTNRKQYVEIEGVESDLLTVITGSILGALLIIYINDIVVQIICLVSSSMLMIPHFLQHLKLLSRTSIMVIFNTKLTRNWHV